jgi:uncharacterized integral membrane protein
VSELHEVRPPGEGPATPPGGGPRKEERRFPIKLILLGLVGLYLLVFIILNSREVSVRFVFFSTRISLIVGLALVAALGFIAGYMTNELRERRKRAAKPQ